MTPPHVLALRALLDEPAPGGTRRLLTAPGCWDGLSALLIEQAGFPAAFLTGGGLAMARLGRPDLGLVTMSELLDAVLQIRDRIALPLLVDGDTGFGDLLTLRRTVRLLERAGASAIQIEDQHFPKRCGHMAGKSVVSPGEAVDRIRAALDARDAMLVIARTDVLALEGVDAAIERAERFAEAGADLIFVEGPRTLDELAEVGSRLRSRAPLVHNAVFGGSSPPVTAADLAGLGFAVALHPLVLMQGMAAAAPRWLEPIGAGRSTVEVAPELLPLRRLSALVGAARAHPARPELAFYEN